MRIDDDRLPFSAVEAKVIDVVTGDLALDNQRGLGDRLSRFERTIVFLLDDLLAGKVLAAAAIAIVQVGSWFATAAVLVPFAAASPAFAAATSEPQKTGAASLGIDPLLIVYFIAFFILGYLQYATTYAAAASLISRTEDLGTVTTPVILPVVGAFLVAQYALVEPNAPIVVACSFIPFLSPFVMFTRVAISVVPWWQPVLALAIDALTVVLCFWAAGRIYRVGMLLYGRLPSPKQILAALRA